MTNKFENMSAKEIAEDIFQNTKDAGDVDAAFEKLKPLGANIIESVVDALEPIVVKDTIEYVRELKSVEEWGYLIEFDKNPKEVLAAAQSILQVFNHVARVKKDAAAPLTKAIVKEMGKLTDSKYNSIKKLDAAVLKAFDAAYAPKKANPFRKPPRHGM